MTNQIEDRLANLAKDVLKDNLQQNSSCPFLSPEDYKTKTGKRFRMTREQKQSGITREQAFQQFMESLAAK